MKIVQTSLLDNEILVKDFNPTFNKIRTAKPGFMKGSFVIYDGPSAFDGVPIIVVATGLDAKSQNEKTGDMVQTWILRKDQFPSEAKKSYNDISVCGDCKHRKEDGMESCYVNLGQGPRSIFNAYLNNRYEKIPLEDIAELFNGLKVRLGSYGDPMAVPFEFWMEVLKNVKSHTGYTHQWQKDTGKNDWAGIVMASVDSVEEHELATHFGYRTFRVRTNREKLIEGEIACPASKEQGQRTECSKCVLCSGNTAKAKHIAIIAHGILALKFLVWKHQMAFDFMNIRNRKFEFAA